MRSLQIIDQGGRSLPATLSPWGRGGQEAVEFALRTVGIATVSIGAPHAVRCNPGLLSEACFATLATVLAEAARAPAYLYSFSGAWHSELLSGAHQAIARIAELRLHTPRPSRRFFGERHRVDTLGRNDPLRGGARPLALDRRRLRPVQPKT